MFVVRLGLALAMLEATTMAVAWACSCETTGPEDAIASGDPIVLATIVGFPQPEPSGGCGGRHDEPGDPFLMTVDIDVTEVIAGDATLGPMQVRMAEDSSCSLPLGEGETWVLQIYDGDLVGGCTASALVTGPDDPLVEALRDAAGP